MLQRYHRLYGLEAYLFSGGHGPGYVGFQIAANRCFEMGRSEVNYSQGDSLLGPYGPLVAYITGFVAVPEWAGGVSQELAGWESCRSEHIALWLENNLALRELFNRNEEVICHWRQQYTVEQSEQYLLMYNLAGLLAQMEGSFPKSPSQCLSGREHDADHIIGNQLRLLGLSDERDGVMGIPGLMIARNGKAVVECELVDVWQSYVDGVDVTDIAKGLYKQKKERDRKDT